MNWEVMSEVVVFYCRNEMKCTKCERRAKRKEFMQSWSTSNRNKSGIIWQRAKEKRKKTSSLRTVCVYVQCSGTLNHRLCETKRDKLAENDKRPTRTRADFFRSRKYWRIDVQSKHGHPIRQPKTISVVIIFFIVRNFKFVFFSRERERESTVPHSISNLRDFLALNFDRFQVNSVRHIPFNRKPFATHCATYFVCVLRVLSLHTIRPYPHTLHICMSVRQHCRPAQYTDYTAHISNDFVLWLIHVRIIVNIEALKLFISFVKVPFVFSIFFPSLVVAAVAVVAVSTISTC